MSDYDLRVLSLGAGTQSSALLMLALRGELPARYLPLDAAIFADTGDEPREVYDWLRVLEREALGKVPIHVVRGADVPLSEWSTSTERKADNLGVPAFVLNRDGTRGMAKRKCTGRFKIVPIKRKVRELLVAKTGSRNTRGRKVQQLIGMSMDEVSRMKPADVQYIDNAWPLVDMRWRRQHSIDYIESLGLGTPPRSACVFCPYRSDAEWRRLRDDDPAGWQAAIEYDERLREANRVWQRRSLETGKKLGAYDGDLFLHKTLLPLADVDLSTEEDHGQGALDLWANECEGMCGA